MSITRRKDGRAMKTVTINGKKKTFYSSEPNDKKAEKDILQQILTYDQKQEFEKHNFLSLAEAMLERKERSVGYNSIVCYQMALKHLERFYKYNIEDITPSMLQNLLDDMALQKYSFSAISKTRTTFGMILNYAILQDIPITNFMKSIQTPKNAQKGHVTSPDDLVIETIINNSTSLDFGLWAMMLLCTGLRRGELAAIRKKDIDFDEDLISVTQTVVYVSNQPHIKSTPKSESGIRTAPILNILKPLLHKHCSGLKPDEFIFGKEKPLTKTQLIKRWDKYCKTIGHNFNMHQLRHAHAKLLYKAGIDPKTMQKLLGHADFSTTMNIYTDFAEEVTAASVEKLNDYTRSTYLS